MLASMPLALFDFSFLDKALFMKMQPGLRAALFAGLLAAVNVLRELVAAYSVAQSQVRVRLHHAPAALLRHTGMICATCQLS